MDNFLQNPEQSSDEKPQDQGPILNSPNITELKGRKWVPALVILLALIGAYLSLAKYENWWPFSNSAVTACGKLSDPLEISHCYGELAIKLNNPSLCEKINGDKDGCYRTVGETIKESSICEKIQGARAKEYCLLHVRNGGLIQETAVTKGNCSNPDIKEQDYCYLVDAFNFEDPSLCEKVQNLTDRDDCYSSMTVALASNVENTCGKIQDMQKREKCYGGVAQAKRDFKICDLISNGEAKYTCYETVSYEIGYREDVSKCLAMQDKNLKTICQKAAADRAANP